jgi:hypothetical protein
MKPERTDRIVGYALLVVGLVFIIIPIAIALYIYFSGSQIPQLVPIPAGEPDDFVRAFAVFSNVWLLFFILAIIVWAGSIISSRGITIMKDVRLKLVRQSVREATETAQKIEGEES